MKLKEYCVAHSVDEVVSLMNKSKKNIILGGSHWLKMGKVNYNVGIDISNLGLDRIDDKETTIEIGGHVSLRQLEVSPVIQKHAAILSEAVASIVGVQFRNTARVGASVYSRFGFSDITAALLTLDTWVEINGKERMSLEGYQLMPKERHFVTKIIINKETLTHTYESMRQNSTSLAFMILAITKNTQDQWRISVGARPSRAMLAHKSMAYLNRGGRDLDQVTKLLVDEADLAENVFASQAYREHLAGVFVKRGVLNIWK